MRGPNDKSFRLFHMVGQQERGKYWRNGEGCEQCTDKRVGVGPRHRIEYLPLDTLHGEQRHESCQDDQRREENGGFDLGSADEDQADLRYEFFIPRAVRKPRGASQEHFAFGRLEHAENILDEDHRRIDNDAEIDRSQ